VCLGVAGTKVAGSAGHHSCFFCPTGAAFVVLIAVTHGNVFVSASTDGTMCSSSSPSLVLLRGHVGNLDLRKDEANMQSAQGRGK
jgi:hypothetical protein